MRPTLKEKKRYILIRSIEGDVKWEDIKKAIREFLGDVGLAEANPKVMEKGKGYIILRVRHDMVDEVRASLVLLDALLSVPRVSGTIKKIRDFIKEGR
ncbi:hypothetical protein DRN62_00880 [Nanoarchaeota archaeon]|nr:MAG: hypothetical protein DRN62_00880 [Nanoarchaeota archaeon]